MRFHKINDQSSITLFFKKIFCSQGFLKIHNSRDISLKDDQFLSFRLSTNGTSNTFIYRFCLAHSSGIKKPFTKSLEHL